jgi:hypothetical protein
MYWQEVPYRAASVVRALLRRRGIGAAPQQPELRSDACFGAPWVRCPPVPTEGDSAGHDLAFHHAAILAQARRLMAGELEVFGQKVAMPGGIPDWNRDPVTGIDIPLQFGLFIDFRHVGHGVDIKHLWEVNRHGWWVTLAQAWAISGDAAFLGRLRALLADWLLRCPYALGANWASPVEHGIRLISWSLVWQILGGKTSPLFDGVGGAQLRARWLASIAQHLHFAVDNYSRWSSADNHLIGEAAGVYIAACTWDAWVDTPAMRAQAKAILEEETQRQFADDGVNLEQAICYHKFSLQFLLGAWLAARAQGRDGSDDFSPAFAHRVEQALVFLAAVTDCDGRQPAIGDADDAVAWSLAATPAFDSGRALLALGAAMTGRADLAAKWRAVSRVSDPQLPWLGLALPDGAPTAEELPAHFPTGGIHLLGRRLHAADELRVLVDTGPLGYNRICGHGHADALSVLVSNGGQPLLVDAGTYCYNAAPALRRYFRGTSAHNTLVVDGRDQSDYGASFLWLRDLNCTVVDAIDGNRSVLHAWHDGYERLADPTRHHRRVSVNGAEQRILVEDWLECAEPHAVELNWHAAAGSTLVAAKGIEGWRLDAGTETLLIRIDDGVAPCPAEVVSGRDDPPQGWVSSRFYQRSAAPVLVCRMRLEPGKRLRTEMRLVHGDLG